MEGKDKKLGDMVFNTPDGIELYRLATVKARLKLESNGLRLSFRKSTRAMVAGELGLTSRDPYERFLVAVQVRIDAIKAKILKDRLVVEEIGPDYKVQSCDRVGYVMAQDDVHKWKVSYYEGGMDKRAKPPEFTTDLVTALDKAEAWCLEVR